MHGLTSPTPALLASYLALLRVVTLVAFGTFPAVGELVVEQSFSIHLQRRAQSAAPFPAAQPRSALAHVLLTCKQPG